MFDSSFLGVVILFFTSKFVSRFPENHDQVRAVFRILFYRFFFFLHFFSFLWQFGVELCAILVISVMQTTSFSQLYVILRFPLPLDWWASPAFFSSSFLSSSTNTAAAPNSVWKVSLHWYLGGKPRISSRPCLLFRVTSVWVAELLQKFCVAWRQVASPLI